MSQTNARELHFYHFYHKWQPFWWTKQTQGNLIFITNGSHSDGANKRKGTSFLSQMTAILMNQTNAREPHFYHKWQPFWWTKQTQGNSFLSQMTAILMNQTNAREPHFYHKWQPFWWTKQTQGNFIFITNDSHCDEPNKRKGTSFLSQMIAILMNQTNAMEPHFYHKWQPLWWSKQTQGNLIFITDDSHYDEPNKRKGTSFLSQMIAIMMNQTNAREPHFYQNWQPFWRTKQTQGNLIFITNDSHSDESNKRNGTSFLSQMIAILMNQTNAREPHFYHKWQPFWWAKQTQGNFIFITNDSHYDEPNKSKGNSFLSQMTAILMNQTNAREPHFYHKWQPFWWSKQTEGNLIFITNDSHSDEPNKRKGTTFLSQMTAILMNQTNARELHFYHKWQPLWWSKQTLGNLIFITDDSHYDEPNKRKGTSFLSQMTAILMNQTNAREPHFYHKWQPFWWTKQTQGNLIFVTNDSHYDERNKRKGTSFLSQMTAIMMNQTNAREPHFYHKWQPVLMSQANARKLHFYHKWQPF